MPCEKCVTNKKMTDTLFCAETCSRFVLFKKITRVVMKR